MNLPDPDRRAPRRRRKLALAVLACGACGFGAWFVAAPLRGAAARVVPEPDIDPRVHTAQPAPGRAGASAATAPAASAVVAVREGPASCGEDQRAQDRTPEPGADGVIVLEPGRPDPDGVVRTSPWQTKPAGVGYTGALHRLDAALRAGTDPFDRTLADWLDLGGVFGSPAARIDALVQDATSSDDPRVYALAYQTCYSFAALYLKQVASPSTSCARLSEAQWARLDPGNALPWIYALSRADLADDLAAQRDAMDRIAASSHVDLRPYVGAAAVARLALQNPADLAAQYDTAIRTLSFEMPNWQSLTQRCQQGAGGDAALASWCARVATLMFENTRDYWPYVIGGSMHRLLTGDKSWSDRAHQDARLMAEQSRAEQVDAPCASERHTLTQLVRIAAIGQLGRAREIRAAASAASR